MGQARKLLRRASLESVLSSVLIAAAIALLALGFGASSAEAKERRPRPRGVFEYGCRVQAPQKALERRSFLRKGMIDTKMHSAAVRYMAEHYGNADDDVTLRYNPKNAHESAKTVYFSRLPVSIHAKIAPAVACVEKRIRATCAASSRYTPRAIGGFRDANTYRGIEISNHMFGVAIDIDPDRNPCCGCVDPWPTNPVCKSPGSVYSRTALPKCWIHAFERYGFDWLGHDSLEDTMHFEFLGDPDRIVK